MIAAELSRDAAVREADTLLLTVPNQLGVEYNAHLLETFAPHRSRARLVCPCSARCSARDYLIFTPFRRRMPRSGDDRKARPGPDSGACHSQSVAATS